MNALIKAVHFLRNPWAIALGVLLGVLVGIFFHEFSELIGPWGDLYIRFLEMSILPIVITAVISSIGKLLKAKGASGYLKKLVLMIIVGLFVASTVGIVSASVGQPGEGLSLESQIELGKIITKFEKGENFEVVPEQIVSLKEDGSSKKEGLFSFFAKLVPSNVFQALSDGENIKILFFSIIFGIALGFIPDAYSTPILNIVHGIFIAMEKIIFFALYALPIALISLLAKQVAETGGTILVILVKYVLLYFTVLIALFLINLTILSRRLKTPFFQSLYALKEALLIGLGSANVYVALPSTLKAMHKEMHLDRHAVNLILPIGISIFPFGSTCFYAFNTLFFAQLFDVPVGLEGYVIVLFGAILASASSVGAPVLIKLSMLAIIFTPLGLPLAPAIAILMAVKPITESFEEVLDLHCNCVLTALIANKVDPHKVAANHNHS